MGKSKYSWVERGTWFEGRPFEITWIHRSDKSKWNLHWQILGKWSENKKLLENKTKFVTKWFAGIENVVTSLAIALGIAGLTSGFGISLVNRALFATVMLLGFIQCILSRTHFTHYIEATATAEVSVSAKAKVIRGNENE